MFYFIFFHIFNIIFYVLKKVCKFFSTWLQKLKEFENGLLSKGKDFTGPKLF